ncbi:hypothetical protein Tco_1203049 [Tanacetum coccineum]
MYMANIQVLTTDSGPTFDVEPLKNVQIDDEYNVFANEHEHIKQPKNMNDTNLMEIIDSNTTPDSLDMCNNDFKDDQYAGKNEDEHVVLANLIVNLKLDTNENKKIQKQLRKANATLTHEMNESKSALEESDDDRCRSALHQKEIELDKYKVFKNCQLEKEEVPYEKDNRWQQPITHEISMLVRNLLMPLAIKTKANANEFEKALIEEMFADLQYVQSLEKEVDELESEKAEFSNDYDILLQECVSKDIMCAILLSFDNINEQTKMQCLYLEKLQECECLEIELSKRNENVRNKSFNELSKKFVELETHCISLELSLQHINKIFHNDRPRKNQDAPEFPEFL